jgi:hypothetical protein
MPGYSDVTALLVAAIGLSLYTLRRRVGGWYVVRAAFRRSWRAAKSSDAQNGPGAVFMLEGAAGLHGESTMRLRY